MSVLRYYTTTEAPSATFRIKGNRLEGRIDGLDAVRQAITLILSTERFAWQIFPDDYGVELHELIGEHRERYMESDIERRIDEALREDDRITETKDYALRFDRESAYIQLTAVTVFGEIQIEREVTLG